MELNEAIRKIIRNFGEGILSDHKFFNVLLDYYHFDMPAKKRIVQSLIVDKQLEGLLNCGDVEFEINRISNYEFQNNGYNEDLIKDVLKDIANGLGKKVKSVDAQEEISKSKSKSHSQSFSQVFHISDVICKVPLLDLFKGVIKKKGSSTSFLESLAAVIGACVDGDNYVKSKELDKAYKQYQKDANKDLFSSIRLAFCYIYGIGTAVDLNKAELELEKHIDKFSVVQYGMGLVYELRHSNESDYITSVKWYLKSAEKDYSPAQTNLGICYFSGKGVSVDYKEAVKWFKKAAKQDNACAQAYLGYCYLNGLGVRKNISEALQLFMKSSDLHHDLLGEYFLGLCYENGIGVSKSRDEAIKLYSASANQGLQEAKDRLAAIS